MNPLKTLFAEQGQAIWLDFVARGFIAKGDLQRMVENDGLRGVTSNPSIFDKAIAHSDEYDDALKAAGRLAGDLALGSRRGGPRRARRRRGGRCGAVGGHGGERLRCRREVRRALDVLREDAAARA